MKNLLMLLLFNAVFAVNESAAQSSCKPCPPDCCTTLGASNADGAAVGHSNLAACCTPEEMKACSSKQKKANRKAGVHNQEQGAKAAFTSHTSAPVGEPAGNGKTSCCTKPAGVKEEL